MVCAFSLTTTTFAQTSTYTGNGGHSNDTWNNPGNWDNGTPAGAVNAVIDTGQYAAAGSGNTPEYTGDLTIRSGGGLLIGGSSGPDDLNAFGGGTVYTEDNTRITFRHPTLTLTNDLDISGRLRINQSESTSGHHTQRHFIGDISGVGTMVVHSVNNNDFHLYGSNSLSGMIIVTNGGSTLNARANYSIGTANVQVDQGASFIIASSLSDVMSDRAELFLNGSGDGASSGKIVLNSSEKVGTLTIDGESKPAGTWGGIGSGATYQTNSFAGTGILTVRWYKIPAPGTLITLL